MKKISSICLILISLTTSYVFSQPAKVWASYFADGLANTSSVVYDPSGYIYIAGNDYNGSLNIGTPNVFLPNYTGNPSAFLAKFDTSGNRIWATYIGNSFASYEPRIALDINGNVVATGWTNGLENKIGTAGTYRPNVPTVNPPTVYSYIIKFNSNGQRIWGTYLENYQLNSTGYQPASISTDIQGNICVCGLVTSCHDIFPTNTYMPVASDTLERGFLLKFNPSGNLLWGTYYGVNKDRAEFVECATDGSIYMTGITNQPSGIATPGTSYPNHIGNTDFESYIVKFSADGQRIWGTYTNGLGRIGGIALTGNSGFYIAAKTMNDTGIATVGTHQQVKSGAYDYALTKWTNTGQKLWGTYYGGSNQEFIPNEPAQNQTPLIPVANVIWRWQSLSVDPLGNPLIVGGTLSDNGIKTGCTYNSKESSPNTGFIAKFHTDGSIMWSSYYDVPLESVACGKGESFYIVTATNINGLSTPGSFQPTKSTAGNAGFLSKMQGDYHCPAINEAVVYENNNHWLSIGQTYSNYQWYFNGNAISGADTFRYPATDTGYYFVTFKSNCNCGYTSDTIFYPPVDTSITGLNLLNDPGRLMKVFPNPAETSVIVKVSFKKSISDLQIMIYDILGRQIVYENPTKIMRYDDGSIEIDIDISALSQGLYTIKLKSGNQNLSSRFMKKYR